MADFPRNGGDQAPSEASSESNANLRHALDTAKQAATGLMAEVKDEAAGLAADVGQKAETQANEGLSSIADSLESLSRGLNQTSANLDDGWATPLVGHAAGALTSIAGYVRHADARSVLADAQRVAKDKPATTMLSAVAVGFAIARAGKVLMSQLPDHDNHGANQGGAS